MKQPLSEGELRMNEQASAVAAKVVGAPVEAATRVEQVSEGQQLEAAGVGAVNRGLVKGMKGFSRLMMPRTGSDMKNMRTGGLPSSWVVAVTRDKVYAIEDKQQDGKLAPGEVVRTWEREGFMVKSGANPGLAAVSGVPEDRQLLILYLPMAGAKSKYYKAAARNVAASGSPGMPTKVMVGKDDASQKVVDAIVSKTPAGANIMIGGQSLQDMMQQSAAQADPTEQLSRLADLHERGALSDDEFAEQKAKILGESQPGVQ